MGIYFEIGISRSSLDIPIIYSRMAIEDISNERILLRCKLVSERFRC